MEIVKTLEKMGVFPVVVLDDAADATPLADALVAGGMPCMEITFRTDAAGEAIAALRDRKDLLLGAGTVTTVERARRAIDAGARFIVSPGTDAEVIAFCREAGVPVTPGVCTPTDIQAALRFDLDLLKFFPAEASGGIKMLKALAAPFPGVRFLPTGGISASNLADWLALPAVAACAGSWIAPRDLIKAGDFGEITRRAGKAVETAGAVART